MASERIEDELEKCLRFDNERIEESEHEKLTRKAVHELRRLREMTAGWHGYAEKDGAYIDDLEYFFSDNQDK